MSVSYGKAEVYAALRAIVLVDRSGTGSDSRASNFMLKGDHGAMEGGVTPAFAFVYFPKHSQIGTENRCQSFKSLMRHRV